MQSSITSVKIRALLTLLVIILIASALLPSPVSPNAKASGDRYKQSSNADRAKQSSLRQKLARLPLSFEENRGQADSKVKFISRCDRYMLFLTATESVMRMANSEQYQQSAILNANSPSTADLKPGAVALKMKFVGANPAAQLTGVDELPGKRNYFIGKDAKKWRANIPTYSKVKSREVYKGIDVDYYGSQRQLEYDVIVAPGADFTVIKIAFEGAKGIRIDSNGDLILETSLGDVRQARPVAYQETTTGRKSVVARYVIADNSEVRFSLGEYDASLPLIIDPVLSYSSFLGGESDDFGSDIAVDSSGNIYVAGQTASNDFPVTPGAIQTIRNRFDTDTFVTKLNPAGTDVIYSTYLGGQSQEIIIFDLHTPREGTPRIAVDSAGHVFITGSTISTDFPVTPGAFQPNLKTAGDDFFRSDTFIAKLSQGGDALMYSTYLGGTETDLACDIAVDNMGFAYVTGNTYSRNFPTVNALQPAHIRDECSRGDFLTECSDVFVTKIDAQGSSLVYSTYLGGNRYDAASGIAIDEDGRVYIAGLTGSFDFPTTPGAFQPNFNGATFPRDNVFNNVGDGFVSCLNTSGSALIYSTFLGGKRDDAIFDIAIDSSGNAYVTGKTDSIDFPTIEGAAQPLNAGSPAYKTQDSGGNWNSIKSGLPVAEVSALAIDPQSPSTIYAASNFIALTTNFGASIFKSMDGGASWKKLAIERVDLIDALAVDPKNSNVVYAGTSAGLFKSTNGGETWVRGDELFPGPISAITIDPRKTKKVYLGTGIESPITGFAGGSISRSTDNGETWKFGNFNGDPFIFTGKVFSIAINPKDTSKLYAATTFGIFRSLNQGKKWKETDLEAVASAVAIDPINPSTLYAAWKTRQDFYDAIYKSTNGGKSWQRLDPGLTGFHISSIAVNPQNPSTIYAGLRRSNVFRSGVLKSVNGGASWNLIGLSDVSVNALVVDPQTPSNVYAGTYADNDIFITKINSEGSTLIYSTYIGGKGRDVAYALAVDSSGQAYMTGETLSADFPLQVAFQSAKLGGSFNIDTFAMMLNASGKGLVYSSYLGGAEDDFGLAITVDGKGAAYLTGMTSSTTFPLVTPFQKAYGGGFFDAFVVKVSPP
jgi:photosystem II stability/assembly factor-like uncharacterized protein